MEKAIEIRDKGFKFWSEYETYLKYAINFVIALALFCYINRTVGFMDQISSFPVALLLALVCCLLPQTMTIVVAATLIILNLYVLSMEVAFTALLIFVMIFLLYFRFSPKDGKLFAITPILCMLNIPYVLPIGTGLLRKAYSVAAVACGTIVYFFLDGIYDNVTALQATMVGAGGVEAAKMTITASQLLANKEMYLTIVVFALSAVVVYIIRQLTIDHAWKVAVVSGALVQISGLFAGYLLFDIQGRTIGMILGNIVATALGFVLEFLFMDLDYSRTERVQFEDDEYYYYVKAVPKKMVSTTDKSVKQYTGLSPFEKMKEKKRRQENKVSRRAIAEELDIDEDLLK